MIYMEKSMIFFDLDDTLLDHKGSEYESVKEFYKQYKYDIRIKQESFYELWCQISKKFFNKYLKLVKLGINNLFTCIITAGEYGIAKPNIKLFETACNQVKLLPEDCYYVGDDLETDILPSNKIGMHSIWLNRKREPLELPNIVMINSLKELRHAL